MTYFPQSDVTTNGYDLDAYTTTGFETIFIKDGITVSALGTQSSAIYGAGILGSTIAVEGTLFSATHDAIQIDGGMSTSIDVYAGGLLLGGWGGVVASWTQSQLRNEGTIHGDSRGVMLSTASDSALQNAGTIKGWTAVELNGTDGSGQHHVVNSGVIMGRDAGIDVNLAQLDLTNTGTIAGTIDGIKGYASSGHIHNSGIISANQGAAILWLPKADSDTTLDLVNTGTITGPQAITLATWAGYAPQAHVANSGFISGDVTFSGRADLYDGVLGQLVGTLNAGAGDDTALGGAGGEHFIGGDGQDLLKGGGGDDWLEGGQGWNTIAGGDGDDLIQGGNQGNNLSGDAGNDIVQGGDWIDILQGGAGDDQMDGGAAADSMQGGDGNDTMVGGDGDDQMQGGAGDDAVSGGAGADEMAGGDGNDSMFGSAGADSMDGGAGIDTLYYIGSVGGVTVNMATGEAFGGDAQGDLFFNFEQIIGSSLDDDITGSVAADTLWGAAGGDTLAGGAGNDVLRGNDGDDVLIGGAGRDVMAGGDGADIFRFGALTDIGKAAGTRDIIRDFEQGSDLIDLALIDPATAAGDQAFALVNKFTGTGVAEVRWLVSNGDTLVQLDANGDKAIDAVLILNGEYGLTASDFLF